MALYFSFSFFYFVLKKIASGVTYMFICIKLNFSRCFCCFVFFLCFFVRCSVTCCLAYSHTHTHNLSVFFFSLIFLLLCKKNHHHLRCLFLGPTLYSLVNVLLRSFLRSLAAARFSNSSQSKISSSSSSSSSSNSEFSFSSSSA